MLSWDNPDPSIKNIKILRSDIYYPSDPYDGYVVYVGRGESFLDTEIELNKKYYYTVFVYDNNDNYSSGGIISGKVSGVDYGESEKAVYDKEKIQSSGDGNLELIKLVQDDFLKPQKDAVLALRRKHTF